MPEFEYPVQNHFPDNCIECPTLCGLIEDGDLLGSISKGQYEQVLSAHGISHEEIKNCPGPIDETDGWQSCTSFLLQELLTNK